MIMNRAVKEMAVVFIMMLALFSCPLPGDEEEPQLILDDDWKIWVRIGPALGFPMGASADVSGKLTFAYGGQVGGSFRKLPGSWSAEFLKTEQTRVEYNAVSDWKAATFSGEDIQLLFSWRLPFGKRSAVSPFVEGIAGGLLYTSSIVARYISMGVAYTVGYDEHQRFTYIFGLGAGASLLIGTIGDEEKARPVGLALQLYARWLFGGPVYLPQEVSGDYPVYHQKNYQSFSLGFGLLFLL